MHIAVVLDVQQSISGLRHHSHFIKTGYLILPENSLNAQLTGSQFQNMLSALSGKDAKTAKTKNLRKAPLGPRCKASFLLFGRLGDEFVRVCVRMCEDMSF